MTVDAVTWGCNAIYRDVMVDNLVAVDYGMQQEIYESNDWRDIHVICKLVSPSC